MIAETKELIILGGVFFGFIIGFSFMMALVAEWISYLEIKELLQEKKKSKSDTEKKIKEAMG